MKSNQIKILVCVLFLLALILAAVYINFWETEEIEGAGTAVNAPIKKESLIYQGTDYPLKKHMQTILLIGTDSTEVYEEKPEEEMDFLSYHQADFLMLLVIDKDSEKTEMIQVNRDTIADVPWLDVFGSYGGTERKQICLAFNYGDGGPSSCRNTVHAVSSLLFDLPISNYIQIPMTAIGQLNDLVGGVPVVIREDMTKVDPSFVEGSTVVLEGGQAEKFVRARRALENDTNIARMSRQREYMDSFMQCADDAAQSDPLFIVRVVEKLGGTLQTNMTDTQLSDMLQSLQNFETSPIRYAEGELKMGARYYEYYVNEASLWNVIRSSCCD